MVDEDSDEEFVSRAAVVSCLFFRLFPQKQQHISHEWLSGAFLVSFFFFLIPRLYKLAVFFFVPSKG